MPGISEYGDIEKKYNIPELSDENYNLLGEIIYSGGSSQDKKGGMMDDLKDIFLDEQKFEDLMNIIKGAVDEFKKLLDEKSQTETYLQTRKLDLLKRKDIEFDKEGKDELKIENLQKQIDSITIIEKQNNDSKIVAVVEKQTDTKEKPGSMNIKQNIKYFLDQFNLLITWLVASQKFMVKSFNKIKESQIAQLATTIAGEKLGFNNYITGQKGGSHEEEKINLLNKYNLCKSENKKWSIDLYTNEQVPPQYKINIDAKIRPEFGHDNTANSIFNELNVLNSRETQYINRFYKLIERGDGKKDTNVSKNFCINMNFKFKITNINNNIENGESSLAVSGDDKSGADEAGEVVEDEGEDLTGGVKSLSPQLQKKKNQDGDSLNEDEMNEDTYNKMQEMQERYKTFTAAVRDAEAVKALNAAARATRLVEKKYIVNNTKTNKPEFILFIELTKHNNDTFVLNQKIYINSAKYLIYENLNFKELNIKNEIENDTINYDTILKNELEIIIKDKNILDQDDKIEEIITEIKTITKDNLQNTKFLNSTTDIENIIFNYKNEINVFLNKNYQTFYNKVYEIYKDNINKYIITIKSLHDNKSPTYDEVIKNTAEMYDKLFSNIHIGDLISEQNINEFYESKIEKNYNINIPIKTYLEDAKKILVNMRNDNPLSGGTGMKGKEEEEEEEKRELLMSALNSEEDGRNSAVERGTKSLSSASGRIENKEHDAVDVAVVVATSSQATADATAAASAPPGPTRPAPAVRAVPTTKIDTIATLLEPLKIKSNSSATSPLEYTLRQNFVNKLIDLLKKLYGNYENNIFFKEIYEEILKKENINEIIRSYFVDFLNKSEIRFNMKKLIENIKNKEINIMNFIDDSIGDSRSESLKLYINIKNIEHFDDIEKKNKITLLSNNASTEKYNLKNIFINEYNKWEKGVFDPIVDIFSNFKAGGYNCNINKIKQNKIEKITEIIQKIQSENGNEENTTIVGRAGGQPPNSEEAKSEGQAKELGNNNLNELNEQLKNERQNIDKKFIKTLTKKEEINSIIEFSCMRDKKEGELYFVKNPLSLYKNKETSMDYCFEHIKKYKKNIDPIIQSLSTSKMGSLNDEIYRFELIFKNKITINILSDYFNNYPTINKETQNNKLFYDLLMVNFNHKKNILDYLDGKQYGSTIKNHIYRILNSNIQQFTNNIKDLPLIYSDLVDTLFYNEHSRSILLSRTTIFEHLKENPPSTYILNWNKVKTEEGETKTEEEETKTEEGETKTFYNNILDNIIKFLCSDISKTRLFNRNYFLYNLKCAMYCIIKFFLLRRLRNLYNKDNMQIMEEYLQLYKHEFEFEVK